MGNDLKTSLGTPTTPGLAMDVTGLKTAVGDSASGLTKMVADNKAVVGAPASFNGMPTSLYAFVKDTCTKAKAALEEGVLTKTMTTDIAGTNPTATELITRLNLIE